MGTFTPSGYPDVWSTGKAMADWDFDESELRNPTAEVNSGGAQVEKPPKDFVTVGDVMGTAAVIGATFGGPLLAIFGKGKVRKAGLAISLAEVATVGVGLGVLTEL